MDERTYLDHAHATLRTLLDAFDAVDIEDADAESSGDVVTVLWRSGTKCIVNTQRPARQLWLAGGDRAWHFSWDAGTSSWLDDKGTGAELLATVADIARQQAGIELRFAR